MLNALSMPLIALPNQLWHNAHMSKMAEIIQEAESLPATERALVVDSLLQSLHAPNPAIDAQWAATAQRRLDELRSGNAKAILGNEVFAKVRKQFSS